MGENAINNLCMSICRIKVFFLICLHSADPLWDFFMYWKKYIGSFRGKHYTFPKLHFFRILGKQPKIVNKQNTLLWCIVYTIFVKIFRQSIYVLYMYSTKQRERYTQFDDVIYCHK